jgi:hypothetical protein
MLMPPSKFKPAALKYVTLANFEAFGELGIHIQGQGLNIWEEFLNEHKEDNLVSDNQPSQIFQFLNVDQAPNKADLFTT